MFFKIENFGKGSQRHPRRIPDQLEGTFMVFGWDAMPDTSKVVIADSVFNVASDVMNGDMTAEQWRDGIEAAFEEIAASK